MCQEISALKSPAAADEGIQITANYSHATRNFTYYSRATLKSYRRTYEVAMPPLSIESLPSDPNILPPLITKKRGRPREKRIRKGAL